MTRSFGALLLAAVITSFAAAGCTLVGLPDIDAACRDRPDTPLCQGALEAAQPALAEYLTPDHSLEVGPVDCNQASCSTSVTALPPADECLPIWSAYVTAPRDGPWQVESVTHGDPACAFED